MNCCFHVDKKCLLSYSLVQIHLWGNMFTFDQKEAENKLKKAENTLVLQP